MKRLFLLVSIFLTLTCSTIAQTGIHPFKFEDAGFLKISNISFFNKNEIVFSHDQSLFSLLIDSIRYQSGPIKTTLKKNEIRFVIADSIEGLILQDKKFEPGLKYTIRFTNKGKVSHKIENLVPMGEGGDKVYITAGGTKEWPQYLCRSLLFRPGLGAVGVILPDNVWHLGFSDFTINDSTSILAAALTGPRLIRVITFRRKGNWAMSPAGALTS